MIKNDREEYKFVEQNQSNFQKTLNQLKHNYIISIEWLKYHYGTIMALLKLTKREEE